MHKAIAVVREEHRSIAAVLHGLKHLASLASGTSVRPDFAVFRAMLYYIDAFPETQHHPKEDAFLFASLERRRPETAELVSALRREHVQGAELVRGLEQALLRFETLWPEGAAAFATAVDAYAEFHWHHMRREEQELLPLAERYLTEADWVEVDTAFATNTDPLSGGAAEDGEFSRLFTRIVNLAPAPVGLGRPWTGTA